MFSGNIPIDMRKKQANAKIDRKKRLYLILFKMRYNPGIKNKIAKPPKINPLLKRTEVIPGIIPRSLNAFNSQLKNSYELMAKAIRNNVRMGDNIPQIPDTFSQNSLLIVIILVPI
jgi:hypothetical protein